VYKVGMHFCKVKIGHPFDDFVRDDNSKYYGALRGFSAIAELLVIATGSNTCQLLRSYDRASDVRRI